MTSTDMEVGAATVRPKTLTASSLIQRALLGIAILTVFILVSALLYDAGTAGHARADGEAVQNATVPNK